MLQWSVQWYTNLRTINDLISYHSCKITNAHSFCQPFRIMTSLCHIPAPYFLCLWPFCVYFITWMLNLPKSNWYVNSWRDTTLQWLSNSQKKPFSDYYQFQLLTCTHKTEIRYMFTGAEAVFWQKTHFMIYGCFGYKNIFADSTNSQNINHLLAY